MFERKIKVEELVKVLRDLKDRRDCGKYNTWEEGYDACLEAIESSLLNEKEKEESSP